MQQSFFSNINDMDVLVLRSVRWTSDWKDARSKSFHKTSEETEDARDVIWNTKLQILP